MENTENTENADFINEMAYLQRVNGCPKFDYIYHNLMNHGIHTKDILGAILSETCWKHSSAGAN